MHLHTPMSKQTNKLTVLGLDLGSNHRKRTKSRSRDAGGSKRPLCRDGNRVPVFVTGGYGRPGSRTTRGITAEGGREGGGRARREAGQEVAVS